MTSLFDDNLQTHIAKLTICSWFGKSHHLHNRKQHYYYYYYFLFASYGQPVNQIHPVGHPARTRPYPGNQKTEVRPPLPLTPSPMTKVTHLNKASINQYQWVCYLWRYKKTFWDIDGPVATIIVPRDKETIFYSKGRADFIPPCGCTLLLLVGCLYTTCGVSVYL